MPPLRQSFKRAADLAVEAPVRFPIRNPCFARGCKPFVRIVDYACHAVESTASLFDEARMKGILIAILLIAAAVVADQYYNYGHYSDGALAMLHQMRHSFGL